MLSPYCLEKCRSSCCDFENLGRGLGEISELELRTIYSLAEGEELGKSTLGIPVIAQSLVQNSPEGDWIALLSKYSYKPHIAICPAYDGNKCLVHDNPDRPSGCDSFPLDFSLVYGKFGVFVHKTSCPAMGKLDLGSLIGECHRRKVAVYDIIFSGKEDKFPDLRRI